MHRFSSTQYLVRITFLLRPRDPIALVWLQLHNYSEKTPAAPTQEWKRSARHHRAGEFLLPGNFSRYTCDVCRVTNWSGKLKHNLIDVTPDPVLSRLEGLNDRMVGRVEMLGGMLILRTVAAAHMSTGETEAQVYPGISNFQTVLTSIGARCDFLYLIKMRTSLCHVLFLPDACVRLGPALPHRDAGDNFLWSEPLHIGTYDSSDIRICM